MHEVVSAPASAGYLDRQHGNSSFLPGLTRLPSQPQIETAGIWLEAESSSDPRVRKIMADVDGIYAIDMLAHAPPIEGAYGHFGMFKHGVLLEHVLSIRTLRLGAEPPRAAKARGG